ncbi:MAG TPA: DNA adenine methylase, partial [Halanaerobiales bacterium]|nr:DNA adenine methylase [Halanaerobiales bacterium]
RDIIPDYKRYVEPFFGGGGIFFQEEPELALINDYNSLLMDFYRLVKRQDKKFGDYLEQFQGNWDKLAQFTDEIKEELSALFKDYRRARINETDVDRQVSELLKNNLEGFNGIFDEGFVVDIDEMFNHIVKAVTAKIKRMKKVEQKKNKKLSRDDIIKNIETGFTGGFYTHYRDVLNDCSLNRRKLPKEKHIAVFYYIREFCYGSMFRYNSKGEFNIPYGGISYNKKDFSSKIDSLFNKEIEGLFKNTEIYDLDFEEFINRTDLNKDDFVFFDPPYDTDFSTYGGNPFGRRDHQRLADVIENMEAKCILIIKNTQFIDELYQGRGLNVSSFEKLYSYNVRGRNNRETRHLIISNY